MGFTPINPTPLPWLESEDEEDWSEYEHDPVDQEEEDEKPYVNPFRDKILASVERMLANVPAKTPAQKRKMLEDDLEQRDESATPAKKRVTRKRASAPRKRSPRVQEMGRTPRMPEPSRKKETKRSPRVQEMGRTPRTPEPSRIETVEPTQDGRASNKSQEEVLSLLNDTATMERPLLISTSPNLPNKRTLILENSSTSKTDDYADRALSEKPISSFDGANISSMGAQKTESGSNRLSTDSAGPIEEMDNWKDADDSIFDGFLYLEKPQNTAVTTSTAPVQTNSGGSSMTPLDLTTPPKPSPFNRHTANDFEIFTDPDVAPKQKTPVPVILRPNLPPLAPSASDIYHLSPHGRTPTCFRIADALRLLNSKSEVPIQTIELYTAVTSSHRQNGVQFFQLADLFFPSRPPYLHATYEKWASSAYYDGDSVELLTANPKNGKMVLRDDLLSTPVSTSTLTSSSSEPQPQPDFAKCRAIVRISKYPRMSSGSPKKTAASSSPFTSSQMVRSSPVTGGARDGKPGFNSPIATVPVAAVMEVEILSIWKCTWADVEYVRGIVMPEGT